jgi:hypothetical protein
MLLVFIAAAIGGIVAGAYGLAMILIGRTIKEENTH